jgi:hypothetical protein
MENWKLVWWIFTNAFVLSIFKADVVCTYIYLLVKRNTTTSNWKYLKFHSHCDWNYVSIRRSCIPDLVQYSFVGSVAQNSSSFLHVDCGGNNFGLLTAPHGLAGSQAKLVAWLEKTLQKCRKNVPNSAAECAITSGCRSGNLHSLEGTKLNIVLYLPSSVLVLIDPSKNETVSLLFF